MFLTVSELDTNVTHVYVGTQLRVVLLVAQITTGTWLLRFELLMSFAFFANVRDVNRRPLVVIPQ